MQKASAGIFRFLITVSFFVCPLIFFTNLTRNPYITQICLLNITLALGSLAFLLHGYFAHGEWRLPRTPLDMPLAAWAAVCLLSWTVGYLGHAAFFRSAIISEGMRAGIFILVNSLIPFYLSAALSSQPSERPSVWPWVLLALAWGALWLTYPGVRGRVGAPSDIWRNVLDGFGVLYWGVGLAAAAWLCRRGRAEDFLHLALCAGFLASVYGVMQYFNKEIFWPQTLNPYGGRSVSTFGNPNFVSTFNVALLPIAMVYYLQARAQGERLAYAIVFLALQAALLCSMTRSSWGGGLISVGLLAFSKELRSKFLEAPRQNGLLAAVALTVVLLWPQSSIGSGYTPSVLGRLSEMVTMPKTEGHYSPWHQRLLIWTCSWLIGAENPLTGKGWGLFELFYPFYQGPLLDAFPFYVPMRTHANNSHNEIMEVWAQTGLAGLGVTVWIWLVFFKSAWRRWFSEGVQDGGLGIAGACGAAGVLLDNLLNVSLHFAVPAFLFWWTAGMAVGRLAQGENRWRTSRGGLLGAGAALVLAAAALGSCWYYVKMWNREVHYFAGFKLLRQNALPAATKHLELSRAWGPREVNAVYELGNVYARSERFEEAVKTYRQALEANAGYDEIYFNIATLMSARLMRVPEALEFFRMAWWINPISPDIYNNMSALFLQNPSAYRGEATTLLENAVRFFPGNANHWNNLGYMYSLAERYPQAEEAYVRALTISPEMNIAERNLAASLARSRRPAPALFSLLGDLKRLEAGVSKGDRSPENLALAERLARALPEMGRTRFFYGSLLLAVGRPLEGIPHLEWVLTQEPRNISARINLGNCYASLGRGLEAAREYRAALALDPQNSFARQRLAEMGISP